MVEPGHVLGWDEFILSQKTAFPALAIASSKVAERGNAVYVRGSDFDLMFDRTSGQMTSWKSKGVERLAQGLQPDFWRFVDNEMRRFAKGNSSREWEKAGPDAQVTRFDVKAASAGEPTTIQVGYSFPEVGCTGEITYSVNGDGSIETQVKYDLSKRPKKISPPMRIGMELKLPEAFEQWQWYGLGPEPTYPDRKYEPLGIFETTVDGAWVDYSRPQENGNHHDTRWSAFLDNGGTGILFIGKDSPLSMGARHYSKETMFKSEYSFQMDRSEDIFVNVDLVQRGVADGWNGGVPKEFELQAKTYAYSFLMVPITQEPIQNAVTRYFG